MLNHAAHFLKMNAEKEIDQSMNHSTTQTQNPGTTNNAGELYAALHDDTGRNTVIIAETVDDWQALTTAGVPVLLCTDQDTPEQLLSMLQAKPTRKTIIVCNAPDNREQWNATAKRIRETTSTIIKSLPAGIRKNMLALQQDPFSEHAPKQAKAIQAYAEHEEEQANPQPGNVLEYLTKGKYTADLQEFQKTTNTRTMFPLLDEQLGDGLFAGLYVIGAPSSIGKTTFSLQMADQLAKQHIHVLFFSMEQSRLELVTKSITRTAREIFPGDQGNLRTSLQIRKGYTTTATEQALKRYADTIAPYMNIIEGNFSTTVNEIRQTVKRYIEQNNVRPVVFIDYLQVMESVKTGHAQDQRTITDQNIKALKILSRDLETPVIVISSVNRSSYYRPITMDSFKESGGVEFTADVSLALEMKLVYSVNFSKLTDSEKENMLEREKKKPCISMIVKGLKNRYGIGKFKIEYTYSQAYDYFKEERLYKGRTEL